MRRVAIAVSAALMLLALSAAPALARHHRRHHRHHARIERFGDVKGSPSSTDNAGTVQSFTNGVLTITLTDGSTASGMVNGDTEIECAAPEDTQGDQGDDDAGDQGGDNNVSNDAQTMSTDGGGDGGDQGDNEDENNCSTANLTPGTVVHEAELRITSAGSVWQKLELNS